MGSIIITNQNHLFICKFGVKNLLASYISPVAISIVSILFVSLPCHVMWIAAKTVVAWAMRCYKARRVSPCQDYESCAMSVHVYALKHQGSISTCLLYTSPSPRD